MRPALSIVLLLALGCTSTEPDPPCVFSPFLGNICIRDAGAAPEHLDDGDAGAPDAVPDAAPE